VSNPEIERVLAASRANNGEAQYELGLAYLNGDGVPQNFVEAYFWLTVCSGTEKVFWSPSPDELASEACLHITDEALLGETINRVILWVAEHGPPVAGDKRPLLLAIARSSANDRAAPLRLHHTVSTVEGGQAADRPAVGPRNQARRLPADGAPRWRPRPVLHAGRL
jgi:hypothetical protein